MKGIISMSTKETQRITIMDNLLAKRIKQKHAAQQLGISIRQVRRLKRRYQQDKIAGLVHQLRGKEGNRRIVQTEKDRLITIVREKYADFGPTFALEKLTQYHGCTFGVDTLRKEMITINIWHPKKRKTLVIHQMRDRRSCFGELVQLDGSPHAWFEGRGHSCTLLVFIDDATGKVPWGQFVESETTAAYFAATKEYIIRYGKPLAFYVDRHGVFRVNTRKAATAAIEDSNGLTQFGRSMQELAIALIFANTPQAKGRVERVNQTLQDRLVKEMRLQGINTIQQANTFLPAFLEGFNRQFSVVPKSPVNMHRTLPETEKLDDILCEKHTRMLSRQLTMSYENRIYQIQTDRPTYAMRFAPVVVQVTTTGVITIEYKGKPLAYTVLETRPKAEIVSSKEVNQAVDQLSARIGIPIQCAEDVLSASSRDNSLEAYQAIH